MNQVTESILINPRIEPTKLYGLTGKKDILSQKTLKIGIL